MVDHIGNTRAMLSTDGSKKFFDYSPFGELLTGEANDDQGWIASERDPESKYMNLCFRLYDPTVGRFLSVDPLFETQIGVTPYHYCGNDPVNFSDPLGLDCDMDLYYGPPAPGDYRSDPETGVMQVWKMKYEDGECGWVFEYGIVNYNNEGDSFAGRQMIIEAPANGKGSSGGGGGSGGSFCSMGWEKSIENSVRCYYKNPVKKKFPSIYRIILNYPQDDENGKHAMPSKIPAYKNQCAIRLALALQKSGVSFDNYPVENKTNDNLKLPRSAKNLADWLWTNFMKPNIITDVDNFITNFSSRMGIVFFYRGNDRKGNDAWHHIDYWNGPSEIKQTGSGFYGSLKGVIQIWFWEIPQ